MDKQLQTDVTPEDHEEVWEARVEDSLHGEPSGHRTALKALVAGHTGRVAVAFAALVAALALLHVLNKVSGAGFGFVDFDDERNLPTWVNSAWFLGVGVLAEILARVSRGRPRIAWRAVAIAFVFFSVDEFAEIHERMGRPVASAADDVWYWPVLLAPVFALALLGLWYVAYDVRRELGSRLPVLLGVCLLGAAVMTDVFGETLVDHLAGAVGLESLSSPLEDPSTAERPSTAPMQVGARTLEEIFELSGALLLIATFGATLERRLKRRYRTDPAGSGATPRPR